MPGACWGYLMPGGASNSKMRWMSPACAEHFCQIGPNGLKLEKETTHDLV